MGFFDNLGKAISDVGQKGKDIASAAKYNRMIADEERDIVRICEQIGKKYFELHEEDFEPEFTEMITQIKEANDRIKGYKDTVDMLQGIVRCTNCGMDIPEGAAFCPECGQRVVVEVKEEEPEPDPDKFYCTECGKEIKPGMKFCIYCGTEVRIPEAAPTDLKEDFQNAVDDLQGVVNDVGNAVSEVQGAFEEKAAEAAEKAEEVIETLKDAEE